MFNAKQLPANKKLDLFIWISQATCPMVVLNDKSKIPAVGLGVYQAKQGPETYEAVMHALKAGYRHIDTAALYGNEESVGKAIVDSKIPRDQIWITTKLWAMEAVRYRDPFDYVIKDAQSRVQRLGTYCDLYLIHSPHGGHAKRVRIWQAMEKLQKDGTVRSIGVSNFHGRHIQALISDPSTNVVPAVNQIELHPFLIQDDIVNYCHKHGIHIEAYSPVCYPCIMLNANIEMTIMMISYVILSSLARQSTQTE